MKTQRTPAERRVRATAADVLRVARMSRPVSEPAWQVFARAAEIAAGATAGLVNDDMVDSARDMARAWVLLTKLAATARERATDRALASLRAVA
jgi:hypothetical protein